MSEYTISLKDVKIIACFPALQYHPEFVGPLTELITSGVLYSWIIPSAALLPQARNKSIAAALEACPDLTHILFIDDDMCNFNANQVLKLLWNMQNNPAIRVCSALVTMRKPPYKIVAQFEEDDPQKMIEYINTGAVLPTKITGMAFTLIAREVLDQIREDTPTGPVWFTLDRDPRLTFDEECRDYITELTKDHTKTLKQKLFDAVEFGMTAHLGAELPGEDASFGNKAIRFNYKMYVDCGVHVSHLGTVPFDFRHAFGAALAANRTDEENFKGVIGDGEIQSAPILGPEPIVDGPHLRLCGNSEG